MTNTLALVLIVVSLIAVFVAPNLMTRMAVREIVAIFRNHGATTPDRAKPRHELGLDPKTLGQRFTTIKRDYKPRALELMIQAQMVKSTSDGRLYLDEPDRQQQA